MIPIPILILIPKYHRPLSKHRSRSKFLTVLDEPIKIIETFFSNQKFPRLNFSLLFPPTELSTFFPLCNFFVPGTNRVKIFWRVFWVFVCYSSNYCFLTWLNGCLELSSNVEKPQMPTEAAELLTKGEASLVFCSIYIGDIKYFCYIWLLTTNTGFKT